MTLDILARAMAGLLLGAAAGWPLAAAARRLARKPVASWAMSLACAPSLALALAARPGDPQAAAVTALLAVALTLLAAVDVTALRLPDVMTLPLVAVGLLLGPQALAPWGARALGAFLGGCSLVAVGEVFHLWRGRSGLGLGDAKLFAAAGAWLGWDQLPQVLLITCAVGLAWTSLRCVRSGMASLAQPIPMGLGLCVGWFTVWILQAM